MTREGTILWIFVTVILWMFAGALTSIHEYFFLANYEGVQGTLPMQEYSFTRNLIAALTWGLIGGLAYALLEVYFFQKRFLRVPFFEVLLIKIGLYTLVLVLLSVCISILYNSVLSARSVSDPTVASDVRAFVTSVAFWHPLTPFIILSIISSVLIHLSERLGGKVLWKLLTGRYHNPKEEQRIFMFLDLNASTSIAEKLGNQKFHNFLNDFFFDIAVAILHHKGEVVEYVGDQVVITWTIAAGTKDASCLRCFQDFQNKIESKKSHYQKRYDCVPKFKAAVHSGKVMIGEIGRLKKSIKFSGDVLNTTARVEKLCNSIGASLAITEDLLDCIGESPYPLERIEAVNLQGKMRDLDIYKVILN